MKYKSAIKFSEEEKIKEGLNVYAFSTVYY